MTIIRKDLPHQIRGTAIKKDGEYYIIINTRYTLEQQEETLKHEMLHIEREDFEKLTLAEAETI